MSIWCCKDCKERRLGCHSTCEKYINQKKIYDEGKEKARKETVIINPGDFDMYQAKHSYRRKKS